MTTFQTKKKNKRIFNWNFFTYKTSISVVNTLMNNPVIVSKFGANHRGTFDTKKHHQGCKIGSRILTFVQAYLCSDNFFNCTPDNNLFLYKNIFRICDIMLIIQRSFNTFPIKVIFILMIIIFWCPQTQFSFLFRFTRKLYVLIISTFNEFDSLKCGVILWKFMMTFDDKIHQMKSLSNGMLTLPWV